MKVFVVVMLLVVVVLAKKEEKEQVPGGAPVVETEGGLVGGVVGKAEGGRHFWAYHGIPFAKPPTGSLRFKPPQVSDGWDKVRNGSTKTPKCLQTDFMKPVEQKSMVGQEDCLYLNVFTPQRDTSKDRSKKGPKKLPVMVFIHGGAFYAGSADEYGPNVFLQYDVVLVVIQYRLGVLGFLSTEDSVIPGNYGMLDQVAALKWVKKNIKAFGGDPKLVTIFGESAGAASVHYHVLSPMSKGLFSKAIAQSGTAINPWARGGYFRQTAENIGHNLGCPDTQDSEELLKCLQSKSGKDVAAYIYNILKFNMSPVLMAPRVDGAFLLEEPAKLVKNIRQHRVPLIIGTTAHEGAIYTAPMNLNDDQMKLIQESSEVQEVSLELKDGDVGKLSDLTSQIFQHYLGGRYFGKENAEELTQMYGDRLFTVGVEEVARRHALSATTFQYQFTYRGQHSLSDMFALVKGKPPLKKDWVCHGDDLFYLFSGNTFTNIFPLVTPEDLRMRDIMVKLWVNFATTGNPTPDGTLGYTWEPVDPLRDPHHLDLTLNSSMKPFTRQEMLNFWSALPLKENLILAPEKVVYTVTDGHKEEL